MPRLAKAAVSATAQDRIALERAVFLRRLAQLFAVVVALGALMGVAAALSLGATGSAGLYLTASVLAAVALVLARPRPELGMLCTGVASLLAVGTGTLAMPSHGEPVLYLIVPATLAVLTIEGPRRRQAAVGGLFASMWSLLAIHHALQPMSFEATATQVFHATVLFALIVGFAELVRERRARDVSLWARANRANQRLATRAVRSARAAQLAHDQTAAVMARISHELRTPLNAILGYSELLDEDPTLSEESRDDVQRIQASGHHLLSLVDALLEINALDGPGPVLANDDIDLDAFLDGLARAAAPLAQSQGNRIETHVTGAAEACIDAARVGRVLAQLLTNASRFTEGGRIELVAHAERGLVRFIVADEGCGIDAERLPHLFEPFTQGADVQFGKGGAGLGLTLADRTVRQLGGHIEVESEVGRGTRFLVAVPQSDATQLGLTPAGAAFPPQP